MFQQKKLIGYAISKKKTLKQLKKLNGPNLHKICINIHNYIAYS